MPSIEVPILETERLRLREGRKEDFSAVAAMWRDPVILRYTTGRALSPEEAWTKSLRNAGLWPMLGYGYWAVEEKASGDFVGELGFADFKREIEPSLAGIPEAGWVLISRVHGRGYATEALGAAVTWGDRTFGAMQTACIIHDGNVASIRLAEKFGYRKLQRTVYKEQPVILLMREPQRDRSQNR
jgi:RimJ/RimL family protein N-acetyltransferase